MLNPTLSKKSENVLAITENAKKLFQVVFSENNKKDEETEEPKIKVSSLISKMAFYYEKIRNSVDYKDEHLLRKNAILRILKRQIVIEGVVQDAISEAVSKHLLTELIRGGYLHNNTVPESKIREIAEVIEKYLKLKRYGLEKFQSDNFEDRSGLVNWILAMAACDIEERLGRDKITQVTINEIYEILLAKIKLPEHSPYADDKDIQIYIGIYRNLLKFDRDMISFILFKYYNAGWNDPVEDRIREVGHNINKLKAAIDRQIDHPLESQLNKVVRQYTVYFSTLTDVVRENPVTVYNNFKDDPKAFPRDIKKTCNKRYQDARSKLWRAALRSVVYIFLTKSVLAVAIEVPAIKLFGEEVNFFALAVNISFPAVLLFLIALFTKLPSEKNTEKIIAGINKIVFRDKRDQEEFIVLREPAPRNVVLNFIFGLLYTATFFVSIGFIVWVLDRIGFNFVSITIFLFFLAFVSFFAIRIRKNAHELMIIENRESIFSFLVDFFYVPIVAVGKWLTEKFSRINLFVFVLDFIIETPFKIFVEIAEEWTKYVKERRDKIM